MVVVSTALHHKKTNLFVWSDNTKHLQSRTMFDDVHLMFHLNLVTYRYPITKPNGILSHP